MLFVRDWAHGRVHPRRTVLDGAILVWVVANLVSSVTSIDPLKSLRDLRSVGHWSVYYLLVFAVARGAGRSLENLWLAAGAACAAQALLQFSLGFDLRGRDHSLPTGFFNGHLELGHYMVMLLGLAIPRWSESPADSRERALLIAAILAFGGALVVSTGRGPWLAFVVVALVWAWVARSWRSLAVLAVVAALQLVVLLREPQALESFYRSYVTFETEGSPVAEDRVASNVWRLTMWREGLRFFTFRPVLGTGVETTGELSRDFRTPFRDFGVAHLHSNYFEILMTRGFAGLAAFLLLLAAAARVLSRALAASEGGSRAAPFGALAALLAHAVHGFTHFSFGSSPIQIGFYVALGLGIGAAERRLGSARVAELAVTRFRLAAGVTTVALAFAVEPWLREHPAVTAILASAAIADALFLWRSGRGSVVSASLAAAFGYVVLSSWFLLAPLPAGEDLALGVMLAAAGPYAVGHFAMRSASGLAARLGERHTVESQAAGR
ncbi:MAG: O-antigen ligase family protein [Candidatus Binatia bacterium]